MPARLQVMLQVGLLIAAGLLCNRDFNSVIAELINIDACLNVLAIWASDRIRGRSSSVSTPAVLVAAACTKVYLDARDEPDRQRMATRMAQTFLEAIVAQDA